MKIKPLNTKDGTVGFRKTLLYAHHGWGKTTQAKYYQQKYGDGFIISGESGLDSVKGAGIDYLPFYSWDDKEQHAGGRFSFKGIIEDVVNTAEFRNKYKWIMVDSLTELSDVSYMNADASASVGKSGEKNGFEVWESHGANLIGACKYIRDLPMHVIVTALAKEEQDENGNVNHWPMLKGKSIQKQLPGIFDCVMCGVRVMTGDPTNPKVMRFTVTDEYKGWHGKVRDENRRLLPVEQEHNIVKLFERMDMTDDEYADYVKSTNKGA